MKTLEALLASRTQLTAAMQDDPYSLDLYDKRAGAYSDLGYPDLAAMDAYKVLLLVDEISDECGECHEEALESFVRFVGADADLDHVSDDVLEAQVTRWLAGATLKLARYLFACGCLKTAHEYVQRALKGAPASVSALQLREAIYQEVRGKRKAAGESWDDADLDSLSFPDSGIVRREVYPWNQHEADRYSPAALDILNAELQKVAPRLEVKLAELPVLASNGESARKDAPLIKQLGIFAKEDLAAGEEILCERSLLTANSQLHEPLCDACNTKLTSIGSGFMTPTTMENGSTHHQSKAVEPQHDPVPCPDCDDTVFCSTNCLSLAQQTYHPATCGADVDNLLKDVPAADASNALYTLLLLRALAMAQTQSKHPLDLKEVKYIWGDFNPAPTTMNPQPPPPDTLFFSFQTNILTPLHFLTHTLFSHGLNVFTAPHELAEPWVHNTLLAKFRATASARMTPRPVVRGRPGAAIAIVAGLPDAAVVHPMWCLANHNCDPNVSWKWDGEEGGEVRFWVREERVRWKRRRRRDGEEGVASSGRSGGIRKGEEILNHYVDVDLPVRERREWGAGALGGFCRCERCMWEEREQLYDDELDASKVISEATARMSLPSS